MATSQLQTLRSWIDLMAADEPNEEENLTWKELAELVDVQPNAEGNLGSVKMVNACLSIQENPRVQNLPTKERIRAIRSAVTAVDHILSSRYR